MLSKEAHPGLFITLVSIARYKGDFFTFSLTSQQVMDHDENSAICSRWVFMRLFNSLRIKNVLTLIWFLYFINLLFQPVDGL